MFHNPDEIGRHHLLTFSSFSLVYYAIKLSYAIRLQNIENILFFKIFMNNSSQNIISSIILLGIYCTLLFCTSYSNTPKNYKIQGLKCNKQGDHLLKDIVNLYYTMVSQFQYVSYVQLVETMISHRRK